MPLRILITNPSQPGVANGNLTTAMRWKGMLEHAFDVDIINPDTFVQSKSAGKYDLMLGIHATRSCAAASYWASSKGYQANCPSLVMVLSGTDLYIDYPDNRDTARSLELAGKLIALQELAPLRLPSDIRNKCAVIYQSCETLTPVVKPSQPFTVVMVGHLRDVKDPLTFISAAKRLANRSDIEFIHIGQSLDDNLKQAAEQAALNLPNYRWLGKLSAQDTRHIIQHAHVLVHASKQEGGAHVIMEAATAGTPIIASHMDGNVGMLGVDYPAYFPVGDYLALVALIERMANPCEQIWASHVKQACENRARLFQPAVEASTLTALVKQQLNTP